MSFIASIKYSRWLTAKYNMNLILYNTHLMINCDIIFWFFLVELPRCPFRSRRSPTAFRPATSVIGSAAPVIGSEPAVTRPSPARRRRGTPPSTASLHRRCAAGKNALKVLLYRLHEVVRYYSESHANNSKIRLLKISMKMAVQLFYALSLKVDLSVCTEFTSLEMKDIKSSS